MLLAHMGLVRRWLAVAGKTKGLKKPKLRIPVPAGSQAHRDRKKEKDRTLCRKEIKA